MNATTLKPTTVVDDLWEVTFLKTASPLDPNLVGVPQFKLHHRTWIIHSLNEPIVGVDGVRTVRPYRRRTYTAATNEKRKWMITYVNNAKCIVSSRNDKTYTYNARKESRRFGVSHDSKTSDPCVASTHPFPTKTFNSPIRSTTTTKNIRTSSYDAYTSVTTTGNLKFVDSIWGLNDSSLPDGTGIISMSVDTGIDVNHGFFFDWGNPVLYGTYSNVAINSFTTNDHTKIKAYFRTSLANGFDSDFVQGHGTFTAGVNVGQPIAGLTGGMNPGAKLIVFDAAGDASNPSSLFIPENFAGMVETAVNLGATYGTQSWGSDSTLYDAYSYQFDSVTYANPTFVMSVSVGNSGSTTIGSPANCKNCLIVGATMISPEAHAELYVDTTTHPEKYQHTSLVSFSSYGYTSDGRRMPLINAPGTSIISASSDPNNPETPHATIRYGSGTSFSCPALPIARLQQYFRDESTNEIPPSYFIRAVSLANTAPGTNTVTGSVPNNPVAQTASNPGRFGVVEFKPDFWFTAKTSGRWIFVKDATGASQRCYSAVGPIIDFVVVLSWNDPPWTGSESTTSSVLVHDLDLQVATSERSWWGNMGWTSDATNNHELVRIATGDNSTIRINVYDYENTGERYAMAIYSSVGLVSIACNATCTEWELAKECDVTHGSGVYFCKSTGEWDSTTCKPYACDTGYAFDATGTCTPTTSTTTCATDKHSTMGLRTNATTCAVQSCEEQYWFDGTKCTCYGIRSSRDGTQLACLSTGVFASMPIRSGGAKTTTLSALCAVISLSFVLIIA